MDEDLQRRCNEQFVRFYELFGQRPSSKWDEQLTDGIVECLTHLASRLANNEKESLTAIVADVVACRMQRNELRYYIMSPAIAIYFTRDLVFSVGNRSISTKNVSIAREDPYRGPTMYSFDYFASSQGTFNPKKLADRIFDAIEETQTASTTKD
jgi:hypothetical protein